DHSIAQRANSAEVGRGLAEHKLGILAHRADLGRAIAIFERDHRWFIDDDTAIAQVNHRVRRAEVDRQIARAEIEKREIHCPSPRRKLARTKGYSEIENPSSSSRRALRAAGRQSKIMVNSV